MSAQDVSDEFLRGGGDMGALMRSMDWSTTPLGPVASWPQSLRTTVSLCLSSTFPILIAWGPERVQIYNDTYRPICGEKHPRSMGQAFNECWASALPAVGGIVDRAQAGQGSYIENLRMFLDRYGYLEEAFMTFSFSPIRDESGDVGGLFHPITETTDRMLGARRTQALRDLTKRLTEAKSLRDVGARLTESFTELELDVPFFGFFAQGASAAELELCEQRGIHGGAELPLHITPGADGGAWKLGQSLSTHDALVLDDLTVRFPELRAGPYSEPPHSALVLPLWSPGTNQAVACLVAGVSPRRALDAAYRAFYEQLRATLGGAIANVLAHEEEQRRAAALAALDRAKTAFFSNVSHEFRTPLTLMLGPLSDALDAPDTALHSAQRERLELVQRNGLRLLKLVNSLLDFSRIEAGRVQASFEPTDVGALSRDLASSFRSAFERAGLALHVEVHAAPRDDVWVDREMWEKIVLNLISNAFKHTFEGEVHVSVSGHDEHVLLRVRDTGVGIPSEELPRLFERFHRVQGTRGRSYEGSGIGLALVQELTRLHGGSVEVESQVGAGSTFRVRIPVGHAHLPPERLRAGKSSVSTATRADAYVHEAASWSIDAAAAFERASAAPLATPARSAPPARVLLADDNADMRAYIERLLAGRYTVEAVADGQAALEAALANPPDLVLSDVMMPRLDGFGLLRALQGDARTASVPVVLLSARAGEEATLEGLTAGASDYLVKPFSARELLARVEATIQIARARARLAEVLEAMGDAFFVVARDGTLSLVNRRLEQMLGAPRERLVGRPAHELAFDEPDFRAHLADALTRALPRRTLLTRDGTWLDVQTYPTPEGAAVFVRDVSDEHRAREALERQAEFEQQLVGIVSHDLRTPLNVITLGTDLLVRADLDPRLLKTVTRIRANADRATRLVRDLLDFTQARLGKGIPVLRQGLDLLPFVQHAVDDLRAAFPNRVLNFEYDDQLLGEWDGDRLAQVVQNLLANALKYSPDATPVTMSCTGSEHEVVMSVQNGGPAIPAALIPELFKPFRRGAIAEGGRAGNIGLGLFIVAQIVRSHAGTVEVRSDEVEGTTFIVRLPRRA